MMSSEQTVILPTSYPVIPSGTGTLVEVDNTNVITIIFRSGCLRQQVELGQEIVLGRTHPSNAFSPEIDLTAYDGLDSGISRLHAVIRHDHTGWHITDLNSSNGTWVNGKRLAPNVAHSLAEVNNIQLARLELKIKLPEEQRLL